jgi:molybdenum cofactor cytidylyltransferase
MAQGLILAGGYSRRFGNNKMLHIMNGEPMIIHVIKAMIPWVSRIFVVTGYYHDDLVQTLINYDKVSIVHNPNYDLGMFSSIQAGVSYLREDFFIIPGDYPFVNSTTYGLLLRGEGDIIGPTYQNIKGHPLLIKARLIEALKNAPKESNLKVFRDQYKVHWIETDDEGILKDIDTINDHFSTIKN